MNLKNIARDSTFLVSMLESTHLAFSTVDQEVTTDGNVYDDVAFAMSNNASTTGILSGIGVNMSSGVNGEYIPYRVKAYVPTSDNIFLRIGYAPATITGSDTASEKNYFHLIGEVDDIFMLKGNNVGDTYYNRAIQFGIIAQNLTITDCSISVQKLDVSPPQFGMAVS